jgi:hypothetical protein
MRPEQLDGIQLWAVGGQIDRSSAGILDEAAGGGRAMHVEVVHHDDVARTKPGNELRPHETSEGVTIDGSRMGHEAWVLAEADGSDDRQSLPIALWSRTDHAHAARRSGELTSHPGLAEGFVDEHGLPLPSCLNERAERPTTLEVLWRVAFYSYEALFFRDRAMRSKARCTEERLVDTPCCSRSATVSSATVASGVIATSSRRACSTRPRIGE